MPAGVDQPHLRVAGRRDEPDRAFLQLDQRVAAPRRLRQGRRRHQADRHRCGEDDHRHGREGGRRLSFPVFAGKLHRHRARSRAGNLQRRHRDRPADGGKQADHQSAGDRRDVDAQHLCRPDRMDVPPARQPREPDHLAPPAQRPRHRHRRHRARPDGGRGPRRGHAVRQWRAHRQRRHRDAGLEHVHAGAGPKARLLRHTQG